MGNLCICVCHRKSDNIDDIINIFLKDITPFIKDSEENYTHVVSRLLQDIKTENCAII